MKKALEIGGFIAGGVLIVFGVVAIALGAWGGHTVNKNLKNEFITGTPDMTPSGIAPEVDAIKAEQQKIAAAQKQGEDPARAANRLHDGRGTLVLGGRRAGEQRQPCGLLRELHAHPCPRIEQRPHVRADGPVRGEAGRPRAVHGLQRRDERHEVRAGRSERRADPSRMVRGTSGPRRRRCPPPSIWPSPPAASRSSRSSLASLCC